MDDIKAKQQVVEKIKEASKILVTVSDNPSVDALSAALGLTLLLDKQEKYATAIFSGETPPAIAFLEPQKTFDDTTDSLRDFIIALNKEKADHLRYKVEGDSVKIFITPYKTTINQDDLEFSQGDYNVELVIAIGVDSQDNLDTALDSHGQILHDAAIITLTAGDKTSTLGGVDWHDAGASSLSEMIAGLAEALKEDKKKPLIDTPIATALLTGIVAETDRFSNEHTTSKVMTVAATLMAAGADQQLIATELQQSRLVQASESTEDTSISPQSSESSTDKKEASSQEKDATRLSIDHDETLAELDERIRGEEAAQEKIEEEIEAAEEAAEEVAEVREQEAIEQAKPLIDTPIATPPSEPTVGSAYSPEEDSIDEPTFGGTLNATTDQAEDDKRRAIEDDQNKTILSHSYIGDSSAASSPADLASGPAGFPGTPDAAPGSMSVSEVPNNDSVHSAYALDDEPQHEGPSIAIGGERVIEPLSHDQPAIQAPLPPAENSPYALPVEPVAPTGLGLPLPPPIPDFSQGLAASIPSGPVPQPGALLGDILAPEAPQTPQDPAQQYMDYETTNTIAAPGSAYAVEDAPALPPIEAAAPLPADPAQQAPSTPPVAPSAPGQFQIPGQQ